MEEYSTTLRLSVEEGLPPPQKGAASRSHLYFLKIGSTSFASATAQVGSKVST